MVNTKKLPDVLIWFFIGIVVFFMAYPFESFSGSIPGHALGIAGTVMMFLALIYPYRKRILKKKSKQNPLMPHVYFGLVGASLVVIHSGHKHASTVGVLIFIATLLVVLSGIVGKMLYAKVSRTLRGHRADIEMLTHFFQDRRKTAGLDLDACRLVFERENFPAWEGEYDDNKPEGVDAADARARCQVLGELVEAMVDKEAAISVFSKTQKYFSFWSNVHIFSTYFLFAMIGVHVLTTLYYGLRWLQ